MMIVKLVGYEIGDDKGEGSGDDKEKGIVKVIMMMTNKIV